MVVVYRGGLCMCGLSRSRCGTAPAARTTAGRAPRLRAVLEFRARALLRGGGLRVRARAAHGAVPQRLLLHVLRAGALVRRRRLRAVRGALHLLEVRRAGRHRPHLAGEAPPHLPPLVAPRDGPALLLQLAQMVVGIGVTVRAVLYQIEGEECSVNKTNSILGLAMYSSYFVLFGIFFVDTYVRSSSKAKRA